MSAGISVPSELITSRRRNYYFDLITGMTNVLTGGPIRTRFGRRYLNVRSFSSFNIF